MPDQPSSGPPSQPIQPARPSRPAGWYADTQSERQWRWWDGGAWTRHTAPRWTPVEIDRARIRPRAWVFSLAAIPAALGVAGAVLLVIAAVQAGSRTVSNLTDPLTPLKAPGSAAVSLRGGEQRTIYTPAGAGGTSAGGTAAGGTAAGGTAASGPVAGDIQCEVRGPGGARAQATIDDGATLERGASDYRSLLDFTAPPGGADSVSCRRVAGAGGPVALEIGPHIAVGEVLGIVARAFGAVGALLLGLVLGAGVGVLVGVLRDRSEKRLRAQTTSAPPPPGAST
jgi:hypothetical protein